MDNKQSKDIKPAVNKIPEVQKRSNVKKFFGSFMASDLEDVKEYIIFEIFLPRVKSLVVDSLNRGTEMMIMGTRNSGSRYTSNGRENYNRCSGPTGANRRIQNGGRNVDNYTGFDNPLWYEDEDAWAVIHDIIDRVENYSANHTLSVSDFLRSSNFQGSIPYTYDDYGWYEEDVRSARPEQIPDGRWLVKMPRPVYLGNGGRR